VGRVIPRYGYSSTTAELLAVAHGLEAMRGYLVPGDTGVMVQSDSVSALSIILTHVEGSWHSAHPDGVQEVPARRKALLRGEKAGVARIRAVLEAHRLRLMTRHVRGHQDGEGRHWVNREVDRLANIAAEAAAGLRAPHGSQLQGRLSRKDRE
jgi:ribonuclease HI